jgi:transcriptional regulator with XRE-family HTH domain
VLKRLRLARPEFRSYASFRKASGIHRPTVENTESGTTKPGIKIIDKWVRACGSTLTQLFAEVEGLSSENETRLRILAGEEEYYGLLTKILERGDAFFVGGIKANLTAHEFASRPRHEPLLSPAVDRPKRPTKARRGNLEPRVRKKKRVGQRSDW